MKISPAVTAEIEAVEMQRETGGYYVSEPIEPGEKRKRQYQPHYTAYVEDRRGRRDLTFDDKLNATVREMIGLVDKVPYGGQDLFTVMAYQHLEDAANEELSDHARTQHFDIAGSWIWMRLSDNMMKSGYADRAMQLFIDAGGL